MEIVRIKLNITRGCFFFFLKIKVYFYFICIGVLLAGTSVYHVCAVPIEARKEHGMDALELEL